VDQVIRWKRRRKPKESSMSTSINFGDLFIGSACDPGRKRGSNQDALAVLLPESGTADPPLLVVADGMGGHLGGETASRLTVEKFREVHSRMQPPFEAEKTLRACVESAHQAIREQSTKDPNLRGMGSTVVAAFLHNRRVHMINVGDSRAYLLRGQKVLQISTDQSWVMDQVRAGMLTLEQAHTHRKRSHLSMALSSNRPVVIPILKEETFQPDDILLLCSDGLWGVVQEALLWAVTNEFEPQEAAEKLVALANQSGGPDNISVIVARRKDRQSMKMADDETTNPGIWK
jgi:serine/threonine protein phosphatase PrpC